MNLKKLLFISSVFVLHTLIVCAQTNKTYMTAVPSTYPDTVNKPAIIITGAQGKTAAENNVQYENKTAAPEPNLSIGKASMVYSPSKANNNTSIKDTVNYSEQKGAVQKVPVNNAAVQPK